MSAAPRGRGRGTRPGARRTRGGGRGTTGGGRAAPRRQAGRGRGTGRTRVSRGLLVAVGALAVLSALAVVYFSPLLGVREVQVAGVSVLSPDDVRSRAAIAEGTPLARLDAEGVSARVRELPRVASVEVRRSWPHTVVLQVVERTPVAVVKEPDGPKLVDGTGLAYAAAPEGAAGLPELVVQRAAPDDPATAAGVRVLVSVPEKVRQEVLTVTARSPSDVRLTLSAGREVRWGGGADSERKAAVLAALLTRPGTVYDVSAPELPTVA
ncbi:cell division protein FtsQ [Streptoalloteichus tenebrarius]|uniref:Cell division protein FtsQ n=1 Tax=Streptoalloteichus tenebrarius (strain ATCC 17920 / DSM 40477 / JCM 4838 / CBS 697.72 / NBRC 16177 / NCIMB 11028 / NRRL B-12390 / A12253. 1 / ISP 5477) TaxID=1933 RepID=A0ABT1HN72_STRSD|nr:FtsQ-type POTRA domain-containing protein [Streptoalloteichus tenebrarius]MCP2256967.1 cell division protein FtsQ [Streptoalloteichus tenebrarius]BFF00122.1 FtsQ-type POTRA domain-containing protein [Streptoalloteichus tenebrarius]